METPTSSVKNKKLSYPPYLIVPEKKEKKGVIRLWRRKEGLGGVVFSLVRGGEEGVFWREEKDVGWRRGREAGNLMLPNCAS